MIDNASDFEALCTTISSIYDLCGIGVQSVYVLPSLWGWMVEMERRLKSPCCFLAHGQQCYEEAIVLWCESRSGKMHVTIKPYGSNRNIPVKIKRSGSKPWKIIVSYREEAK